jgi:hypothetical protein
MEGRSRPNRSRPPTPLGTPLDPVLLPPPPERRLVDAEDACSLGEGGGAGDHAADVLLPGSKRRRQAPTPVEWTEPRARRSDRP